LKEHLKEHIYAFVRDFDLELLVAETP